MNIWPDRRHQPRPGRLRPARAAAIIIVLAGVALLAAACGGRPSSAGADGSGNGAGAATSASGVAYAQCVRAHGVPNFPDNGAADKAAAFPALQQVSDSVARAATAACANLDPSTLANHVLTTQQQQDFLRVTACIRSHGFPTLPDPTFPGGILQPHPVPAGIDTSSQQFRQAFLACRHFAPAGLGGSGSGS